MRRRRVLTMAAVSLALVAVVLGGVVATHDGGSSTAEARAEADAAIPVVARGNMIVRTVVAGDARGNGRVERVSIGRAGAARVTDLECMRVYMAAGHGICMALAPSGVDYTVKTFDRRFHVVSDAPLDGLPSRARVSPSGRWGGITSFVDGHGYEDEGGLSTQTLLIDMRTGRSVANLEEFSATKNGRRFRRDDFNYWGLTFARDDDRFYATLATGGKRYLVQGSIRHRSVRLLRANVECPSLSPDGTRIAYKKRMGAPDDWRLHVLDLRTMRDTPLAEERSIDDQAEWLGRNTVIYGDGRDVWAVRADGAGRPRRLIRDVESPAA
jgi:hypothetical protein